VYNSHKAQSGVAASDDKSFELKAQSAVAFRRWEARYPMVGRQDDPRTDLVAYCCIVGTCA
jgi:hypothetical protein